MARNTRQTRSTDTETDGNNDEVVELKRQLDALRAESASKDSLIQQERSAREQAEARSMSEGERRLRAELASTETSLASMDSEAASIEDQIAQLADQPGNGKEIAGLNRKLATLAARTETETQRKSFIANQIERAKADAEKTKPAQGEILASGVPLSDMDPKVQAWFRERPKAFTDQVYLNRVVAAANYAANVKGLAVNSKEYFEFVENETGETRANPRQEDNDDGEELGTAPANNASPYSKTKEEDGRDLDYSVRNPQPSAAGRGAMAAAAAPSRNVPGGNGSRQNGRTPLLTPEEREVADGIYSHIKNPADRYQKYAEGREWAKSRTSGLAMN